MPYVSDKQRKFMHARHPGIAARWDAEIKGKKSRRELVEKNKRDRQKAALKAQAAQTGQTQKQVRAARVAANQQQHAAYVARRFPAAKPSPMYRLAGVRIPGGRVAVGTGLVGAGILGGAAVGSAFKKKPEPELVGKATKKDAAQTGAGAAAGGAGAAGLYVGGGYAVNKPLQRWARNDPQSKKLMSRYSREMKVPKGGFKGSAVDYATRDKFYRNIPAGVKGAGLRRALARTHGSHWYGRMIVPVALAGAATGGTAVIASKSDERVLIAKKRTTFAQRQLAPVLNQANQMAGQHIADADAKVAHRIAQVNNTIGNLNAASTHAANKVNNASKLIGRRTALGIGGGLIVGMTAGEAGRQGVLHLVNRRKKQEPVVVKIKKDSDYPFLLSNIREQVQIGIPETRRNPISPLQMLAASNIVGEGVVKVKSRNPFFRTSRTQAGVHQIALGSTMAVQPLGIGRSLW